MDWIWKSPLADVELHAAVGEFCRAIRCKMHDFYYRRLLDDATKFDPRAGNRFLEILDSGV
jgi:hypothetical protein